MKILRGNSLKKNSEKKQVSDFPRQLLKCFLNIIIKFFNCRFYRLSSYFQYLVKTSESSLLSKPSKQHRAPFYAINNYSKSLESMLEDGMSDEKKFFSTPLFVVKNGISLSISGSTHVRWLIFRLVVVEF